MTLTQFRAQMLGYALGMGKALCESMSLDDTKIEPEQVRKNVNAILVLLYTVAVCGFKTALTGYNYKIFVFIFVRRGVSHVYNAILVLLTECEDFLKSFNENKNECSNSD